MSGIILATKEQKESYDGLYPLHGFIKPARDLPVCILEDLRGQWKAPDPIWELRAPEGYHFDNIETHGLLGHSLADIRERFEAYDVVLCGDCCDCKLED